ncbi:MAG TPA: recombination protein O N-terminal domain-containing protein [Candidatus Nanoarchaeia archaeon]|nr:recombination protein O N-terminal domain-containing protein [Candidatus Nanoarchaeia archaeon]
MSHHVYNTTGLILDKIAAGETSDFVYVFTRDLGLVGAHAQGTRSMKSKIRYAIDAPARSTVSLVRGKNKWRLISAVPEKSYFATFRNDPEKQKLCAQTLYLIKKLLAGEDPNQELFQIVNDGLDFLDTGISTDIPDQIRNFEAILILRILHILGYIPETETLKPFYMSIDWDVELVMSLAPVRKEAVRVINDSLQATGL